MKDAGPTDLTRSIAGSLDQTALTSAKLTSASMTSSIATTLETMARMSAAMKAAGPTDLTRSIAGSMDQTALTSAKLTSASMTSTTEGSRSGDALGLWASTIGPPEVAGSTVSPGFVGRGSSLSTDGLILRSIFEACVTLKGFEIYIEHNVALNHLLSLISIAMIVRGASRWTVSHWR
jgi:hypothetical protein